MTTDERTVGRYLRWLLAALSLGAGVIHFSVSGEHYELSWAHGAFFALIGWAQVLFAVVIVLRPTRLLLTAGAVVNAGIIVVWIMSRTVGVPIGPEAWTSEPIELADALSTGFEVGLVALSVAVLLRPALARQRLRPSLAIPGLGISMLAVAVVSSMAVAPAFASGHSHGEAAGDGHAHGAAGGQTITGSTPCEKSGPPVSEGQITGAGGHGHRGPSVWKAIKTTEVRDELGFQLAIAHEVTVQYPTVKEAEAGGYRMVTGYVPCIGAHYINAAYIGRFDPAKPSMLLYDGTDDDSKIVGLSYSTLGDPDNPPEGFAGPNDPWHKHDSNGGLCMRGGVVVGAESTTEKQCDARGGHKVALPNLWMMHAWVADSWPSSWGLFSAEHPELGGIVGDITAKPTAASKRQVGDVSET